MMIYRNYPSKVFIALFAVVSMPGFQASAQQSSGCEDIGYCQMSSGNGAYCLLLSEATCLENGGTFTGPEPCWDCTGCGLGQYGSGFPFPSEGLDGLCYDPWLSVACDNGITSPAECEAMGYAWIDTTKGQSMLSGPTILTRNYNVVDYPSGGEIFTAVGFEQTNLGDLPARSDENDDSDGTIYVTSNAYVLEIARETKGGGKLTRIQQVARSGMFQHFFLLSSFEPCLTCSPTNGDALGRGCSHFVSPGLSAVSKYPRSLVKPSCGCFAWDRYIPSGNDRSNLLYIDPCLRSNTSCGDIDGDGDEDFQDYTSRRFFIESYTVSPDDATYQNIRYLASHAEVVHLNLNQQISTACRPTITRLADLDDHNDGDGRPGYMVKEMSVTESDIATGVYIVAGDAFDNEDGTWSYEYAVWNHNSDAAMGSFAVPVPASATITSWDFDGVDSPRSGLELYGDESGHRADWNIERAGDTIRFSTTPFLGEPDQVKYPKGVLPNPLEWGSMYNFRFTCDVPPTEESSVELGLFRMAAFGETTMVGPSITSTCLGDVNGDGQVDAADLGLLLGAWNTSNPETDINGDGNTDASDLGLVLGAWGKCS